MCVFPNDTATLAIWKTNISTIKTKGVKKLAALIYVHFEAWLNSPYRLVQVPFTEMDNLTKTNGIHVSII